MVARIQHNAKSRSQLIAKRMFLTQSVINETLHSNFRSKRIFNTHVFSYKRKSYRNAKSVVYVLILSLMFWHNQEFHTSQLNVWYYNLKFLVTRKIENKASGKRLITNYSTNTDSPVSYILSRMFAL